MFLLFLCIFTLNVYAAETGFVSKFKLSIGKTKTPNSPPLEIPFSPHESRRAELGLPARTSEEMIKAHKVAVLSQLARSPEKKGKDHVDNFKEEADSDSDELQFDMEE